MSNFSFEIALEFEEEPGLVYARIKPAFQAEPLSRVALQALFEAAGYSRFYVVQDGIDQLLQADAELCTQCLQTLKERKEAQCADPNSLVCDIASVTPDMSADAISAELDTRALLDLLGDDLPRFLVAQRLDAVVELETREDDTEAWVSIQPPFGGAPADVERIVRALKAKGVSFGINAAAIDEVAATQSMAPVLVATGVKPLRGGDSTFEALVSSHVHSAPKIDEKGNANYLDINEFVLVKEGEPLMRRHTPKPGRPGKDVFGKPVPAPRGEVLPFYANIEGAHISATDNNLLVAAIKGHPILHERGVSVDPALVLTNVSLATGNIDFDGSVHVKEDVADGMTVKASGQVTVNGVVGKARIIAEGDITIDQGLIGATVADEATNIPEFQAFIETCGNFSARFVSCAQVHAKGVIAVREYASHSELITDDKVLIGQDGGKGALIGGFTKAGNAVVANILGTKGSVPTEIRIGAKPDTLPKLRRVMQQIKERETYITGVQEQLTVINNRTKLTGLNPQTAAVVKKLVDSLKTPELEIRELRKEEKQLQTLLVKSKAARVIARRQIYQNVSVQILHTGKKVAEDQGPGKFRFDARQTVLEK